MEHLIGLPVSNMAGIGGFPCNICSFVTDQHIFFPQDYFRKQKLFHCMYQQLIKYKNHETALFFFYLSSNFIFIRPESYGSQMRASVTSENVRYDRYITSHGYWIVETVSILIEQFAYQFSKIIFVTIKLRESRFWNHCLVVNMNQDLYKSQNPKSKKGILHPYVFVHQGFSVEPTQL